MCNLDKDSDNLFLLHSASAGPEQRLGAQISVIWQFAPSYYQSCYLHRENTELHASVVGISLSSPSNTVLSFHVIFSNMVDSEYLDQGVCTTQLPLLQKSTKINKLKRRKGLFWHTILAVSAHDQLTWCFGATSKQHIMVETSCFGICSLHGSNETKKVRKGLGSQCPH
jgi:hypothetical protein